MNARLTNGARRAMVLIAALTLASGCTPQRREPAPTREPTQAVPRASVSQPNDPAQDAAVVQAPIDASPSPVPTPAVPAAPAPAAPAPLALRDFLPHIRLDATARVVEFDGVVPINAHDERAPSVYLEVLACGRDTREHEAVVVTDARPSQVHAALLAIGLEPGKPGSYSWQGQQVQANAPTGPRVRVEVIVGEGAPSLLTDWAINAKSGQTLTAALRESGHAMLFAGSVSVERDGGINYLGDGGGTLVGLSTFGTETIACESLFNPDSAVEEPIWIANAALVPATGTAVRVRITAE